MITDLILGTAGHIDHGKTSLVKALTGVDTDRLPEEKKRGITIDLGFAELTLGPYRLGIVDVPGHERFVRNMLAGATGIDLALLVIAADDSVKPQTREHLEILKLLNLHAGVIALTKVDLPAPDWIELVEEEVRSLVQGTFLEGAPIVRTSSHTGQGLDELKAALAKAAEQAAGRKTASGPFRLAIDRAFTIAGHGTVVTGSVSSGRVRVGDELRMEPGALAVRVRGLQNHDRPVEEVHRGQRAAINLAGVRHDEIGRGQELAGPGHLVPSKTITVRLSLLKSMRPLKHRSRVRVHLGTAELMASVSLPDRERLEPGETAFAQLHLAAPAVSVWGQALVIRSESPVVTIGGGQVLDPQAARVSRRAAPLAQWEALTSADLSARAAAAAYLRGWSPWQPGDLARLAGVDDGAQVCKELVARKELVLIPISHSKTLLASRLALEELWGRIEAALEKLHEHDPLHATVERAKLTARFERLAGEGLIDAVLVGMAAAGRLRLTQRTVALAGKGPKLSESERRLLEQIVETYRAAGYQPPSPEEIKSQAARNQAAVPELIELAVAEDRLVKIAPGLLLHVDAEQGLRTTLTPALASGGLTVSQIREILGTTRKYAVPICEYLDRIGFTHREGDLRVLAGKPGV